MHPVLFDIKGFKIYTYGPIMALGFLLAFVLLYHIVKKRGDNVEFYMDLYLWLIIGGVVGAKLLFNIIEYKDFLERPLHMLNCRNGGLVWYGGVIANIFIVIWYSRKHGQPVFRVTDNLVAPLALGLAVGRWGCLMGGCCFGKVCSYPWAVVYPAEVNEVSGLPVHPTPIYESLASLLICAVIYLAIRKDARQGVATLLWFMLYPLARFIIEFYRGDVVRGFIYEGDAFSISTSQFIGLIIFFAALANLLWLWRHPEDLVPEKGKDTGKGKPAKKAK